MRADGKRLKNLKPFFEIIPYIMNKRVDAQNFIKQEIDAAPIKEYIDSYRGQGYGISHLSVVIAAYLRTVEEHPALNYFVVNKKIYERNHFCVSFVVLKSDGGDERTEQTVLKTFFGKDDDIFSISKAINDAVISNRDVKTNNSMDKLLSKLMHFPGLATFSVGFVKLMDHFGLLPRKVIDASPFHTTLFITNMASIRSNYIYHHVYEFGTTSVFFALGKQEQKLSLKRDGTVTAKDVIPMGIVTDERIASGHYYTTAFRTFRKYLANPRLLEKNPPAKAALDTVETTMVVS